MVRILLAFLLVLLAAAPAVAETVSFLAPPLEGTVRPLPPVFVATAPVGAEALRDTERHDFTPPAFSAPTFSQPPAPNPSFSNPSFSNPTFSNPTFTTPGFTNPTFTNPTLTNPTLSNPTFSSPTF